jgi:hypothetical protein
MAVRVSMCCARLLSSWHGWLTGLAAHCRTSSVLSDIHAVVQLQVAMIVAAGVLPALAAKAATRR